eukprot:jgi/Botrbrau1/10619/Bobra.154_1s0009.1
MVKGISCANIGTRNSFYHTPISGHLGAPRINIKSNISVAKGLISVIVVATRFLACTQQVWSGVRAGGRTSASQYLGTSPREAADGFNLEVQGRPASPCV